MTLIQIFERLRVAEVRMAAMLPRNEFRLTVYLGKNEHEMVIGDARSHYALMECIERRNRIGNADVVFVKAESFFRIGIELL